MIGNDVVDILQSRIESDWQRRGFLNKLFVAHEQQIIQQARDAEKMIWRLWSMKEAAYKIYNRQTGIRGFFPLELHCDIENNKAGKVTCKGNIYFTETDIIDNVIHTIAVCNKEDFDFVYEPDNFDVIKDSLGLPFAKGNNGMVNPASISHHGKHIKIVSLQKEIPLILEA